MFRLKVNKRRCFTLTTNIRGTRIHIMQYSCRPSKWARERNAMINSRIPYIKLNYVYEQLVVAF